STGPPWRPPICSGRPGRYGHTATCAPGALRRGTGPARTQGLRPEEGSGRSFHPVGRGCGTPGTRSCRTPGPTVLCHAMFPRLAAENRGTRRAPRPPTPPAPIHSAPGRTRSPVGRALPTTATPCGPRPPPVQFVKSRARRPRDGAVAPTTTDRRDERPARTPTERATVRYPAAVVI